jgi:hypothetical protein
MIDYIIKLITDNVTRTDKLSTAFGMYCEMIECDLSSL